MDRTIPELSIDSKMLYDRLIKAEVGAVIPYRELTEVISRDVQGPARGNMNTARHRALRHNGMVFEAVWKVGLKRLNETEVVAVGEARLGRIRRVARRGLEKLGSVQKFDALPEAAKVKHNAAVSILGAFRLMSAPDKMKKFEQEIANTQGKLALAGTLELFLGRDVA